jgi:hypothetical protein
MTLTGTRVGSVSGRDYAPMALSTHALAVGVYLLEIRHGGESLIRPVHVSR